MRVQSQHMSSVAFAYIHWTVGRAALIFGFCNMFLGIGRYRTEFTLGTWAETLLGFWIASLVIVRPWPVLRAVPSCLQQLPSPMHAQNSLRA